MNAVECANISLLLFAQSFRLPLLHLMMYILHMLEGRPQVAHYNSITNSTHSVADRYTGITLVIRLHDVVATLLLIAS